MKKYIFIIIMLILTTTTITYYIFRNLNEIEISMSNFESICADKNSNITDTIWCGTFQLAWNELKEYIDGNIKFVNNESDKFLDNLNNNDFSKEMLNKDSYYIKVSKNYLNLKNDIYNELNKKFDIKDTLILNSIDTNNSNGIIIYSYLDKEFRYPKKFDETKFYFHDKENNIIKVNGFGFDEKTFRNLTSNVELLYLSESRGEYAIKLNTKEMEEIIVYMSRNTIDFSLNELYEELKCRIDNYTGKNTLNEYDILKIPNIKLQTYINYSQLCNKEIEGTGGMYISKAIQNINFCLNRSGGKIKSEAVIETDYISAPTSKAICYIFNKPFVVFIKEKNKQDYYFAVKIEDTTFLEEISH